MYSFKYDLISLSGHCEETLAQYVLQRCFSLLRFETSKSLSIWNIPLHLSGFWLERCNTLTLFLIHNSAVYLLRCLGLLHQSNFSCRTDGQSSEKPTLLWRWVHRRLKRATNYHHSCQTIWVIVCFTFSLHWRHGWWYFLYCVVWRNPPSPFHRKSLWIN